MAAAGQSYSLLAKNRQWRIEIPKYNNRENAPKSECFQFGYYIPSERRWVDYQRHRSLPPCTRRDAVDIQHEKDYIRLKRRLNRPNGSSLLGNLPGPVPAMRTYGHKRLPQEPCVTRHFAHCYHPGRAYPCDYHEALDSFNNRQCRPPTPGCCNVRASSSCGFPRSDCL